MQTTYSEYTHTTYSESSLANPCHSSKDGPGFQSSSRTHSSSTYFPRCTSAARGILILPRGTSLALQVSILMVPRQTQGGKSANLQLLQTEAQLGLFSLPKIVTNTESKPEFSGGCIMVEHKLNLIQ